LDTNVGMVQNYIHDAQTTDYIDAIEVSSRCS
jgi:hypothetical protein